MRNPLLIGKLLWASIKLVKDPKRLEEVIEMADAISSPEVMEQFVIDAQRTKNGASGLANRPRVTIDTRAFSALPIGTLGRAYADFMTANGLYAEDLPNRPSGNEHEWVRAHLFETHDIWHVVTGFRTDEAGELGLQAFYLAQLPARLAPLLLAIGFLNTALFAFHDKHARMDAIAAGWALGKQADGFFGVDWNAMWSKPIGEVRQLLGVTPVDQQRVAA
jgi:ubiquinone biosynthesis protein COQ4